MAALGRLAAAAATAAVEAAVLVKRNTVTGKLVPSSICHCPHCRSSEVPAQDRRVGGTRGHSNTWESHRNPSLLSLFSCHHLSGHCR